LKKSELLFRVIRPEGIGCEIFAAGRENHKVVGFVEDEIDGIERGVTNHNAFRDLGDHR